MHDRITLKIRMGTKRYSSTAAPRKRGKDRYVVRLRPLILFKMKKTLRARN
jgi:hypothetical protein